MQLLEFLVDAYENFDIYVTTTSSIITGSVNYMRNSAMKIKGRNDSGDENANGHGERDMRRED